MGCYSNISISGSVFKNFLPVIPPIAAVLAVGEAMENRISPPLIAAKIVVALAKITDVAFYCLRGLRVLGVFSAVSLSVTTYCWIGSAVLNTGSIVLNVNEGLESRRFQKDNSNKDLIKCVSELTDGQIQKYFKVDASVLRSKIPNALSRINRDAVNQILSKRISQINKSRLIGSLAALVFLVAAMVLVTAYATPVLIAILTLGYGFAFWEWYNNRSNKFLNLIDDQCLCSK